MASELQSIQKWYRYNSFARKKYLRLIFSKKISEKERYKSRGASFPSLVDIFVHVLDAYRWWFLYVYIDRMSEWKRLREAKRCSKKEVTEEEQKIDSYVMNFVNSLRPKDLYSPMRNQTGKGTIELRKMLLHMVEEELQHRGELNALLWQMNVEPPITHFQDCISLDQKGRKN